jgi:hypothetical protein
MPTDQDTRLAWAPALIRANPVSTAAVAQREPCFSIELRILISLRESLKNVIELLTRQAGRKIPNAVQILVSRQDILLQSVSSMPDL